MSKERPLVLLVEDEPEFSDFMRRTFGQWYRMVHAPTLQAAGKALRNGHYQLLLLDLTFGSGAQSDLEGLQHIRRFKSYAPGMPLIVVTKDQKSSTVVKAMKNGADNYVRKDEFDVKGWKALFDQYLDQKAQVEKEEKPVSSKTRDFIGETEAILRIKQSLRKLSEIPDITVMLTGETGVGKEVAARYLHQFGKRKDKPFKAVNLSVITDSLLESTLFGHRKGAFTDAREDMKGAFEEADSGILFLDEIGEINPSIQVKLLRFLEDKKITPVGGKEIQLDVQIVVATNRNLKEEVEKGNFRSDLYYRLNQFAIHIPPLRKRRRDVELLLDHYLSVNGIPLSALEPATLEKLLAYHWPGNVRELVNLVKRLAVYQKMQGVDRIGVDLLPEEVRAHQVSGEEVATELSDLELETALTELNAIEKALREHRKKGDAARVLQLNLDKLKYKIDKYYEMAPELFERFPTISQKYKLQ